MTQVLVAAIWCTGQISDRKILPRRKLILSIQLLCGIDFSNTIRLILSMEVVELILETQRKVFTWVIVILFLLLLHFLIGPKDYKNYL
jgi:hypothetical protein